MSPSFTVTSLPKIKGHKPRGLAQLPLPAVPSAALVGRASRGRAESHILSNRILHGIPGASCSEKRLRSLFTCNALLNDNKPFTLSPSLKRCPCHFDSGTGSISWERLLLYPVAKPASCPYFLSNEHSRARPLQCVTHGEPKEVSASARIRERKCH